jgi:formate hydrogenlyase subunit 3/multisubunit Na+/H+ antiporter MnhD subunit
MTGAALLVATLAAPVVALALVLAPRTAEAGLRLAPWAAAPAIAAALLAGDARIDMPWLMLGASFGLEGPRPAFLLLAGLVWTAAGVYARAYHAADPARRRLFAFHLATMAGNLGLAVSLDAISFYLCFVAMSLAAYGLVVHDGSREARRAGFVYLILVFVGEGLILPGLWLAPAASPGLMLADIAAAAEAGAVPLHVWLPLAHPAAPTPASAILSGVMIKAGVLAWLVFLPLDGSAAWLGAAFVVAGLVNAFYGAAVGICQRRVKTVLAYSSISQMGLIMVAVGAALMTGSGAAVAAAAFYSVPHGLAKAALFLGVGVAGRAVGGMARRIVLALTVIPALALAGFPLTSGFAAKALLKDGVDMLGAGMAGPVATLLSLGAVATTLIMARFLVLLAGQEGTREGLRRLAVPWAALIALGLALGGAAGSGADYGEAGTVWNALWPVLAGAGLAFAAWRMRGRRRLPAVPEGDILQPVGRGATHMARALLAGAGRAAPGTAIPARPVSWGQRVAGLLAGRAAAVEAALAHGSRSALAVVVILSLALWLMVRAS